MEQYLIDTNVVSGYLSASLPVAGLTLLDKIIDAIPKISVISQIELLSWETDNATAINVENFISDASIFNLTPETIISCVQLRKKRKIKIPDAIIAATALVHNCTLVTNNEKDFSNIKDLKIINPSKLPH
ncbi:MAG: hypothetical protein BGN92_07500 [Sphingobacteriales bacterium 41-5]|nr:MAG: hypothetical protein ABS67_00400 [Niabella sp. SCN 42-15]OJU26715.1 MAG: hypothetical protein BGN92_07500 [Sphingobacteriales bacterium 41-5]